MNGKSSFDLSSNLGVVAVLVDIRRPLSFRQRYRALEELIDLLLVRILAHEPASVSVQPVHLACSYHSPGAP